MVIVKEIFSNEDDKMMPILKFVLTKINDEYILYQKYKKYKQEEWQDSHSTSYFNGEKMINGKVTHINGSYNVDEYFNLLVKYEGWKIIEE